MKTDDTMLLLIEILKELNVIKYEKEFCDAIGLAKGNLWNIRNGRNHFTPNHIRLACKEYEVNANWILGLNHKIFTHNRYSPETPINTVLKDVS